MTFGDLRGILQYVPQFRGRLFVVSVDGAVIASPGFSNILLDLAVLHSLNVRIILSYGAAFQIRHLAEARGVTISNDNGSGRTDDATLEVAIDAISRLTSRLMQDLTSVGLRAASPNALIARPAGVIAGTDLEHTGRIEKVDTAGLTALLSEGMIPLVPPLGFGAKGDTLRVNSDAAACEIGTSTKASKVVYISSDQILEPGGNRIARLSVEEAKALAASPGGSLPPGLASKLRYGARACENGVPRTHVVDGTQEEVLLAELFSNEGVGTMIHEDDYVSIRPATSADVPEMVSMMRQSVEDTALLARTREEFLDRLDDFFVLTVDNHVVGCVALHDLGSQVSELACLYVKREHSEQGYGTRLVTFACEEATKKGARRLIALSTQASRFFVSNGFEIAGTDALPPTRLSTYLAAGRNARILVKSLL